MSAEHHPLTWASPRPLWRGAVTPGLSPTILRFATDDFMDQLIGLLASDPAALSGHVARAETWRTPAAALATDDLVQRVPLPAPARQARLGRLLGRAAPPPPAAPVDQPLKLYQPAHQRYYVVAATLACAVPGLPDRTPAGGHERSGFVLRRLMPPSARAEDAGTLVEYGWVTGPEAGRWQKVSDGDPAVLAPGEELLPVFPMAHLDSKQVRRTMWSGLIPVGRREEYIGGEVVRKAVRLIDGQLDALQPTAPEAPRNSTIARMTEFKLDFAEPWKAMIAAAQKAAADIKADPDDTDNLGLSGATRRQKRARAQNLQAQMQSWLLLVDLAAYLEARLHPVWLAVKNHSPSGLTEKQFELYTFLEAQLPQIEANALRNGMRLPGSAADTLPYRRSIGAALRGIIGKQEVIDRLEANETIYEASTDPAKMALWPDFHFLLAGVATDGGAGAASVVANGPAQFLGGLAAKASPSLPDYPDEQDPAGVLTPLEATGATTPSSLDVDKLTALIGRALDQSTEQDARPLPFAQKLAQTMAVTASDPGLFCVRFVHLNEDCGPLHPPVLSEPTERFRLASFFDPDAPVRPIRITLPADTSPAGLRKHARGTAFVMSNMLCGQVQRAKGMGFIDLVLQVLPWPLHKDMDLGDGGGCKNGQLDIGMICSLSIPIITLCALILLMIIVSLLDFVFRWLPWFVLCFPVPKLKGKEATP